MILSICDEPKILEVLRIVSIIITIIKIAVPIMLLLSLMIKFLRAVSHEEEFEKAKKGAISSIIAAVLIFMIPTFVSLIAKTTLGNTNYKNCINITSESINEIYNARAKEYTKRAESSLNNNDYSQALLYLNNVKDPELKKELQERLDKIKGSISKNNSNKATANEYANPDYSKFKWTYYYSRTGGVSKYYSDCFPYGVYAPEDKSALNGVSLPLIIWLHGANEQMYTLTADNFFRNVLTKALYKWETTGMAQIPAIIIAPQSNGEWDKDRQFETVKASIEYAKEEYNIDLDNVVLMGHSMGGRGTIYLSYGMYKKYGKNYFSAIVPMSSNVKEAYPKDDANAGYEFFSKVKLRGYGEGQEVNGFYKWLHKESMYTYLPNTSHGGVPLAAFKIDENNNKVSDLLEWLFGDKADTTKKYIGGATNEIADNVTPGTFTPDPGETVSCLSGGKYNKCSPKLGVFGSFSYYDSNPDSTDDRWSMNINPSWVNNYFFKYTKTCDNGWTIKIEMHKRAETTWKKVLDKLCEITTTGIDGYKYTPDDIKLSGTKASGTARFVTGTKSPSFHGYGIALDINSGYKIEVNGKTYKPYQRDKDQYTKFVEALGNERDSRNINFILWKKIFQPLGFQWGGNWNGKSFDGMHFEIDYKQTK